MPTKYPKLWDGASAVGEAKVRALQQIDAPFLSASGPGFTASKMGEFSEVKGTPGLDGYYSLGDLGGSTYYTVSSLTAKGKFRDRGEWAGGAFAQPSITYIGRGTGVVPETSLAGGGAYEASLYTTKDAKRFKFLTGFVSYSDGDDNFIYVFNAGSRFSENVGDSVEVRRCLGAFVCDATLSPFYRLTQDGGKTWEYYSMPRVVGVKHYIPYHNRVSPSKLIAFVPVPISGDPEQTNRKASFLCYSENGGRTWTSMSMGDWGDNMRDNISSGNHNAHLRFIRGASLIVPFRNEYLAIVSNPYWLGVSPLATQTWLFSIGEFFSPPSLIGPLLGDGLPGYSTESHVFQTGKLLVWLRPQNNTSPCVIAEYDFAEDSWSSRSAPWIARNTGTFQGFSEKEVCATVYVDGSVLLMRSLDCGVTWEQRAVVKAGVPEPATGANALGRFGRIAILRQKGLEAPYTPGSPWQTDDRTPFPDWMAP